MILNFTFKYRHAIFLYFILDFGFVNPPFSVPELVAYSAFFGSIIVTEIVFGLAEAKEYKKNKKRFDRLNRQIEVYNNGKNVH